MLLAHVPIEATGVFPTGALLLGVVGTHLVGSALLGRRRPPSRAADAATPDPADPATPDPADPATPDPHGRLGVTGVTGVTGLAGLALVLSVAALGPQTPSATFIDTLVLRVLLAVVVIVSTLLGPWWPRVDPVRVLHRLSGPGTPDTTAPTAVCSVALLLAWALADLRWRPGGSAFLLAAGAYGTLLLIGAARNGGRWAGRVEVLSAISGTLGLLHPRGRPVGRLLALPDPLPAALTSAVLVGWAIAELLMDSTWWTGVLLTGRPGLLGPAVLLGSTAATAAALGLGLGRIFAAAAVPLAGAWAVAQHIGPLVTGLAGTAVWASDPFAVGWDLLGTAGRLADPNAVPAGWLVAAQLSALLWGHLLAAAVIRRRAAERTGGRSGAAALALRPQALVLASLTAASSMQLLGT